MKFKHCFALTVILIILFSLATVTASENITSCTPTSEDVLAVEANSQNPVESAITEEIIESSNISNKEIFSSDDDKEEVDLSVWVDYEKVYKGNKFNCEGVEIPWTITVSVTGGTAHNVKVHESLSSNMEYISHKESTGTYDETSGIWSIGDLTSSNNATLIIITKLLEDGRFVNIVKATTDSIDIDESNNFIKLPISTGENKSKSNITETPEDKEKNKHTKRIKSSGEGPVTRFKNEEESESPQNEEPTNIDNDQQTEKGYDSKNSGFERSVSPNSKTKTILTGNNANLLTKTTKSITNSLSNSIRNIVNPIVSSNNESSNLNITNEVIKAIPSYDYTRIPILIFTAFIIILLGIVAYDKIKS